MNVMIHIAQFNISILFLYFLDYKGYLPISGTLHGSCKNTVNILIIDL